MSAGLVPALAQISPPQPAGLAGRHPTEERTASVIVAVMMPVVMPVIGAFAIIIAAVRGHRVADEGPGSGSDIDQVRPGRR